MSAGTSPAPAEEKRREEKQQKNVEGIIHPGTGIGRQSGKRSVLTTELKDQNIFNLLIPKSEAFFYLVGAICDEGGEEAYIVIEPIVLPSHLGPLS